MKLQCKTVGNPGGLPIPMTDTGVLCNGTFPKTNIEQCTQMLAVNLTGTFLRKSAIYSFSPRERSSF